MKQKWSITAMMLFGMFVFSSCVNDLYYDIYDEESGLFIPRNKRGKDNPGSQPQAIDYSTFPTSSDIAKNYDFQTKAEQCWNNMLNNLYQDGRTQEWGFVIYYVNNQIVCGEIFSGDLAMQPSISFDGCLTATVCGHFHTHTSMYYWPSNARREVGPSDADKGGRTKSKIPGFVYDYNGDGNGYIYGGTSSDAPHHIYTFGPDRRQE